MKLRDYIITILFLILISNCDSNVKSPTSVERPHFASGYAPVNGLNMYYEIYGEGNPIVLIHGGGSTIQSTFGRIIPLLAEKYKVIAMELQAHGRTNDRDAPESFEQDADDVAALLNHLSISKASFMGFSNGGSTAMQIGIRHPEMVNKLIIASAFYKREGMVKGLFDGLEKATLNDMPKELRDAYLAVNNDSNGLKKMFERDRTRMVTFKDWKDEDLASIKATSLIMIGDKDVVTPEHAVEMSHKIPNCQLMILPGNHGSFLGELMSTKDSSRILSLTVGVIEEFLEK